MPNPNPILPVPKRLGRPPGSKSKVHNDIRQYARQYSIEAVDKFVHAVYAADKILDRAIGKAAQAQTGENGEGPINHRVLVEFVRAQPMKEIDHE
jgi:hypothetical protein